MARHAAAAPTASPCKNSASDPQRNCSLRAESFASLLSKVLLLKSM